MDVEGTARATIAGHPEQVEAWLAERPGAWGFLAGQAVLRERERLGRRLTEPERRRVWAALWAELERLRR
ncbi:MAG TPA: hypothetical protein VGL23_02375 [Chloroflexota bacterium]